MATLVFNEFRGVAPKIDAKLLNKGYAQQAQNVRFDRNKLEPFVGNTQVKALPGLVKTIYKYTDTHWFQSTEELFFVEAPIVNNINKYIVWAASDYPRIADNTAALATEPYPTNSYKLEVTRPQNAPTLAKAGTESGDLETVSYVYTYVDAYGRESMPSPPSNSLDVTFPSQSITITFDPHPTSLGDNWTGAKVRIYRSNAGASSAEYQFLVELSDTNPYVDTVVSEELQEILPSATWDSPPTDIKQLEGLPGGYLGGITDTEVMFSEINVLHAWPVEYREVIKEKPVRLINSSDGLVVLTESNPYIVQGSDPSAMSSFRLDYNQACISKRSAVAINGQVLYSSPDGLCAISGSQLSVVTQQLFSKDEWLELEPETIHAYEYEGLYIAFCGTGENKKGFVYDPKLNTFSYLTFYAHGGYRKGEELYLVTGNGVDGYNIVSFNSDNASPLSYTWKSRIELTPEATNFGYLKIIHTGTDVSIDIKATFPYDGAIQTHDFSYTYGYQPMPIESGFLANEWEITLTGTTPVLMVQLANSWGEL